MKEKVINVLTKATKLNKKEIANLIEIPPSSDLGDFAFPCFILSKKQKKNPSKIASDLAKKISSKDFEKVESKGPYVNFFLDYKSTAKKILSQIKKEKDKYGSSNIGKGKKALVEHTSINPNASPHVGRVRNALIGDSIVQILKFQGFKVDTRYFVNDMGKQIALLVLGSRKKKNLKFKDLLDLYVKASKDLQKNKALEEDVFKLLEKLEKGDSKTKKEFNWVVNICVKGQIEILSKIGIKYDHFDYESEYLWSKKVQNVLTKLKKTGKTFLDQGRIVLNQEKYNLPLKSPVLVLTRADKTSLYPLRDMAYTIDKMKMNKDNNIIVLGEDQKTYFQQLKAALDSLGIKSPKPIFYSFILLADGKMSTRKGHVVLFEDFLKEATQKAKSELKKRKEKDLKRAPLIANAATRYSILKISPSRNVIFNLSSALSTEGDTGPYLLYTYARARSILRKAKSKKNYKIDTLDSSEKNLISQLVNFQNVVSASYTRLSPNLLANYSYQLSRSFNEFYHASKVLGSEKEQFRLALVSAFSQVLKNSLHLLGIETIERM